MKKYITVVETAEYTRHAKELLSSEERENFINFIASNPTAGALVVGTGGARKLRWANLNHKGKSGGARIIYYYHSESMPLFLFTIYGKSEKSTISAQ